MTRTILSPFQRLVCLAVLAAQAACMTGPRAVGPAPGMYLQSASPRKVWVSLANGDSMTIEGPKVYGDSLLGYTYKEQVREEVWLPLSDVTEVKARHLSAPRTALLIGALAIGTVVAIVNIPSGGGERIPACSQQTTQDCQSSM